MRKSKLLTTTIRRPKLTEAAPKGRSLEDFGNILSADSSVHEPEVMLVNAKSRGRRPQSMLLRGVSTFSITAPEAPHKPRAKPRGPLLKDRSLQVYMMIRLCVFLGGDSNVHRRTLTEVDPSLSSRQLQQKRPQHRRRR